MQYKLFYYSQKVFSLLCTFATIVQVSKAFAAAASTISFQYVYIMRSQLELQQLLPAHLSEEIATKQKDIRIQKTKREFFSS